MGEFDKTRGHSEEELSGGKWVPLEGTTMYERLESGELPPLTPEAERIMSEVKQDDVESFVRSTDPPAIDEFRPTIIE
jgi:hypothetical protein